MPDSFYLLIIRYETTTLSDPDANILAPTIILLLESIVQLGITYRCDEDANATGLSIVFLPTFLVTSPDNLLNVTLSQ